MPNDTQQTEATLADLAVQLVLSRAPALASHYLGFDLIQGSMNEDKTRAAGLLGFRVGQELLSIPVLFLNGRIKGIEVLYMNTPDVFTSNSPQWVDYLLSRDSSMMGAGATPSSPIQQPGARGMRVFFAPPTSINKSALLKTANLSDKEKEFFARSASNFWEKVANVDPATANFYSAPNFTVKNVLQKLGRHAYANFMSGLSERPELLAKIASQMDVEKELLIDSWPEEGLASNEKTAEFFDGVKTAMDQVQLITIYPSDLLNMRKEAISWDTVNGLIDAEAGKESVRDVETAAASSKAKSVTAGETPGQNRGSEIGAGLGQGLKNLLAVGAGQTAGFVGAPLLGAAVGALANGAYTPDDNERRRRRIVGALAGGAIGAVAAPLASSLGGYLGAKMAAIENLTRAEREKCMTDGVLFIDKRAADETSLVVEEEYTNRFSSPPASGFYEVLNRGGELEKLFVGLSPFIIEDPRVSLPGPVLLDVESGVTIVPAFNAQVFVRSRLTPAEAVWKEKFTGMTAVSGMEVNKHYILISPTLKVSAPFKVVNKMTSGDAAEFRCETPWDLKYRATSSAYAGMPCGIPLGCSSSSSDKYDSCTLKVVDREDEGAVARVGTITFVPSSWRVQEVYGESDQLTYNQSYTPHFEESAEAKKDREKRIEKKKVYDRIFPGGSAAISALMFNKKEFRTSLSKEGGLSTYSLDVDGKVTAGLTKIAVLTNLTAGLNFSMEKAAEMLEASNGGMATRYVTPKAMSTSPIAKLAYHGLNQDGVLYGGVSIPETYTGMGANPSGMPEEQLGVSQQPIALNNVSDPANDWRDLSSGTWNQNQSMGQEDFDFLTRVADSGSKQVLETSMIDLLLKTNRVSNQVDEWVPDLVNALDSKCRMLLLFYWHSSDFASDYGKDEMAEFEDVLLNGIKVEGQLVLFLKQRSRDSNHALTGAFA